LKKEPNKAGDAMPISSRFPLPGMPPLETFRELKCTSKSTSKVYSEIHSRPIGSAENRVKKGGRRRIPTKESAV
jgi:hypothetical protein